MKISMLWVLGVLCLIPSAHAAVQEEELGNVITVKRTFTIDLAKCEAAYVDYSGKLFPGGMCVVSEGTYPPGENYSGEPIKADDSVGPWGISAVEIYAKANGYQITYSDQTGAGKTDWASAKPAIEKVLSEKIPNNQIAVYVQTYRPKLSLGSLLGFGPKEKPAFSYQFQSNGCDTGAHEFKDTQKESARDQACKAVHDEKLNNSCAQDLRKQYFAQNCPGMKW
jgi:hypothetical protein